MQADTRTKVKIAEAQQIYEQNEQFDMQRSIFTSPLPTCSIFMVEEEHSNSQ